MNTTPHKWSGVLRKLKAFDDHPEVWRNNIRGGSFRPCSAYNLWWITVSVVEVFGLKQLPNSWASAECFLTHRAPKVTITSQTLATTTNNFRKTKEQVQCDKRISLSLSLFLYTENAERPWNTLVDESNVSGRPRQFSSIPLMTQHTLSALEAKWYSGTQKNTVNVDYVRHCRWHHWGKVSTNKQEARNVKGFAVVVVAQLFNFTFIENFVQRNSNKKNI